MEVTLTQSITDQEFSDATTKYYSRILNYCGKRMGWHVDHEDVCQTVFLKAYKALDSFKADSSLYTWFHCIAANCVTDWQRRTYGKVNKKKKTGDPSDFEIVGMAHNPEDALGFLMSRAGNVDRSDPYEEMKGQDVQRILDRIIETSLNEKEKQVFTLAALHGMPIKKVAEETGLNEQAVRNRIHVSRNKIRAALIKQGVLPNVHKDDKNEKGG